MFFLISCFSCSILTCAAEELTDLNVSNVVEDSSCSIGRRYARTDEIGVPFGVTVDFASLTANTVTLRERNTTKQLRVPVRTRLFQSCHLSVCLCVCMCACVCVCVSASVCMRTCMRACACKIQCL